MPTVHQRPPLVADAAAAPVPPSPGDTGGFGLARGWIAVLAGLLLASLVVGAAYLPVPYVALRPGSARPVTDQVLVEGAPSYPPEQSIAFTTVNVGDTTLLEALVGWLDDDVDVLPEERIRGDRDDEENRRYNAQLMDTSKAIATAVALRHLGHEVKISTSGTVVRNVTQDSPAAEVLQLDDVIVAVDGEPVDEPGELGVLLQEGGVGAEHTLTVERPAGGDTTVEVPITTVGAPDDPERPIIGIIPEERLTAFDYPFDVFIDSGTVGGPSAGLAFTLALIDVLTPGELTGGHRVAVTGTMLLDGTVGPVGGGAQKATAVRNAGYEVFLVPPDELEEVKSVIGDAVDVIAVGTLTEALEALDSIGGNAGSLPSAAPARP